MQKLPYAVVTNPNISHVYGLYLKAFDSLRKVPHIANLQENDDYCETVRSNLQEHLTIIPSLNMGVIECRDAVSSSAIDHFMNIMLRSRISRRVIAEQHLALTSAFRTNLKSGLLNDDSPDNVSEFVGDVFLRCKVKDVLEKCGDLMRGITREAYGSDVAVPEIVISGHTEATFPYIPSHLEYILGELLRNSIQAVTERHLSGKGPLAPIEVLICEAPQNVILRFSDQGGGIPNDILPHIWSFSKGPRSQTRLRNLLKVPQMAATLQEIRNTAENLVEVGAGSIAGVVSQDSRVESNSSLVTLAGRPPNLRLGMGLPMSKVYAEFWAGSLELQSLEGYGSDIFLQISRLGNQSEQFDYKSEFGLDIDY
jgi:pyruvate dehydrogenase kinase 2/3/4